ncbi:MAG: MSMEG_0570 family nitrogen starvation response protein [Pseudomonadota bacterium]
MPELRMRIRWPDGKEGQVYSPSTVLARHFRPGEAIALAAFRARARRALEAASDRVAEVHGAPCSRAAAEIRAVERCAAAQPDGLVHVIALS